MIEFFPYDYSAYLVHLSVGNMHSNSLGFYKKKKFRIADKDDDNDDVFEIEIYLHIK